MAHRVARRVHAFELDGPADLDQVAGLDAAVHPGNARAGFVVRNHLRTRGGHHGGVAAGVVMMLVGVEDLRDLPALVPCDGQAFLAVQRIDRQRLSGLRTAIR